MNGQLPIQNDYIFGLLVFIISTGLPIILSMFLSRIGLKLKLSWPVYVFSVIVLSVILTVVFLVTYSQPVPATYILGLALGSGILVLIFYYDVTQMDTAPKTNLVVGQIDFGSKIRLRQVFQLAIRLEECGKLFYENLAVRLSSEDAKKLCRTLAREEEEHKHVFQKHLSQWQSVHFNEQYIDALVTDLRQKGFFSEAMPPETGEKEMLAYAIAQEEKTAQFYQALESTFPEAWKRLHIQQLVVIERAHAAKLRQVLV